MDPGEGARDKSRMLEDSPAATLRRLMTKRFRKKCRVFTRLTVDSDRGAYPRWWILLSPLVFSACGEPVGSPRRVGQKSTIRAGRGRAGMLSIGPVRQFGGGRSVFTLRPRISHLTGPIVTSVDAESGRAPSQAALEVDSSRHFATWLRDAGLSLAVSTYQTGKLFLIGHRPTGPHPGDAPRTAIFERTFERVMGLWSDGQTLWMSTAWQLWRLENDLATGESWQDYDRCFAPRLAHVTGEIDAHDLGVTAGGDVVFANTLFSCLARPSERHSFEPIWKPGFISKLAAEDRCHLNGIAWVDGQPRYVTVCGATDVFDGWRAMRAGGGLLLDVTAGSGDSEIIARGLSMPHSPRWHADRCWLLDSGTGYLGFVDPRTSLFERVTFCPGFARGLAIHGGYAIVGLSQSRRERTFSGLPLGDELARRNAEPMCGVMVINLATGDVEHWLRFGGLVHELYDVVVLPGVRRARMVGFQTNEIRRRVTFEVQGTAPRWLADG